jgi:D-aminopeptidase
MTALDSATSGQVAEGTVGAGTGMVSYGFKGGIGTSSRKLSEKEGGYTVGVLVNANHGRRPELVVNGIPVGKLYDPLQQVSEVIVPGQSEGSIIVVIATDAPLDGRQLTRLAKRAPLGLARTGSTVRHGSGDFILAFSTANVIPHYPKDPTYNMIHLADTNLNPLFAATVEATEEAILNALTMATTVTGRDNHRIEAIDLARLKALLSGSR